MDPAMCNLSTFAKSAMLLGDPAVVKDSILSIPVSQSLQVCAGHILNFTLLFWGLMQSICFSSTPSNIHVTHIVT